MGRGRSSASWPPAAPAVLLLLLLVCFSHCMAAARLRPLQPAVVRHHQAENNDATAAAADDGSLVIQEGEAAGNSGDELSSISDSQMMGTDAAEAAAATICEGDNDECLERRLLGDAHLDYIYTQRKGKQP